MFPGTRVRGGATVAERASDRAYEALRAEILSLRLAPGQLLPEVETAARIGVSRTPLREALSRLGADGLLVQEGGRGQVIAPVDSGQVRQLFELRQALDQQAARLAGCRLKVSARESGMGKAFVAIALVGTALGLAACATAPSGPFRTDC